MKRIGFRGRLFLILLFFALLPSLVLTVAWAATTWWALPLVGSSAAAWDSAATTGARAIRVARTRPLSRADSVAIATHEETLKQSQMQARRASFVFQRAPVPAAIAAVLALALLLVVASRVAGSLSRSLSRPLNELMGWTERIVRGAPLPDETNARGAPEFDVLRSRMREMAAELDSGRRSALEAERLSAFRETARQVAHELKNPLTPIKFAVERLRRESSPVLRESIDVLVTETARLEGLARSFAQFGRLPEGPPAPVDLGELARYTARSSVPDGVTLEVRVAEDVPLISGHHDALGRALSNVIINAVEASGSSGSIIVDVGRVRSNGRESVELSVKDSGVGISSDRLSRIWEPYVTYKSGGTG
ncbi:MAG TPA: histidine kinase dimerization/phospho-acceptor domain-containing protein, partial [Gemmatimonadaceae bacterium]